MQQRFARSYDEIGGIFDFTDVFFERERVDERSRYAVNLALEEVFTNMVKYSPEGRHKILIALHCADRTLRVEITDFDVDSFDVTRAPEPRTDLPLEQRRVGGLGLFLTKKMMDSVDYSHVDRNSTITMTKKLG